MQNWRKYRNFRKHENTNGSFTYVITVDGKKIAVSKDVYEAYAEGGYKMENTAAFKRDRVLKDSTGRAVRDEHDNAVMLPEREVSLDKLIENGWEYPSSTPLPEEVLIKAFEIEEVRRCIALLTDDERNLIECIYFDGMTERAYSVKTGIAQKTVNDRKHRVLDKLKKYLSN